MLTELIDLIYNVISSICVLFPYYSIDTVHSIFGVSKQEKKKAQNKRNKSKKRKATSVERRRREKKNEEEKHNKKYKYVYFFVLDIDMHKSIKHL
jgi:hypothetical protein